MRKNLTEKELDDLAMEVISFLKEWGLWRDVTILTNGNRYSYSHDKNVEYKGISNVVFEKNIDFEEYTSGLMGYTDDDGVRHSLWKNFSNPKRLFDMVFEGPLYMLFKDEGECYVKKEDLSAEAWDTIWEKCYDAKDLVYDYISDKYDAYCIEELFDQIVTGKFQNKGQEISLWDPLEFDTWEEYMEFIGCEDDNLDLRYEQYDNYEEYAQDMDKIDCMDIEDVRPIWDKLFEEGKEYVMKTESIEEIDISCLHDFLYNEFWAIFERHVLWFEFCFSWSITCFLK